MNGQRAILFATDPPYLVGYDGTNHPGTKAWEAERNPGLGFSCGYSVSEFAGRRVF
jgi:hypothetical protein